MQCLCASHNDATPCGYCVLKLGAAEKTDLQLVHNYNKLSLPQAT